MRSSELRHLVVATDAAFVVPTATTLRSISLHDPGPLHVTVLSTGVGEEARRRVGASIASEGLELRWFDMTDSDVRDTSRGVLAKAASFRLHIDRAVPAEVSQVLYLDTDILVEDSLQPLWELPPTDAIVRAVRSVNFPSICTYGAVDHWPELRLDPRAPYFNSGVLMIDMERWRERDIGRRAIEFLASNLSTGRLADQEALNVVLSGHWDELDPRWNQQTPLHAHNRGAQLLYDDDTIDRARRDPAVIHFLDRPKPWHSDCTHPAAGRWRKVASDTAFAPIQLERTKLMDIVRWRVRRAASALVKGR